MAYPLDSSQVFFSDITSTSYTVTAYQSEGGILERQFGWSHAQNGMLEGILAAPNTNPSVLSVTGQTPGVTLWWFHRVRNATGWSFWSAATQVTPRGVPFPPTTVQYSDIKQTSVFAYIGAPPPEGDGGSPITEYQMGHALDPDFTTATLGPNFVTVTDLLPGRTYYFWGRAKNAYGWGGWSDTTAVTLIAGARVKVGDVWRRAVPYVKVNGVWRLAKPYVKISGIWKETL